MNQIVIREAKEPVEVVPTWERSISPGTNEGATSRCPPHLDAEDVTEDSREMEDHVVRFAMNLATISSASVAHDNNRWELNALLGPGEAMRQRAFSALFGAIRSGQRLTFVHCMRRDEQGRPCYTMRIEGETRHGYHEIAQDMARELQSELRIALAIGAPHFGFRIVTDPLPSRRSWPEVHAHTLVCAGVILEHGQKCRVGFSDQSMNEIGVVLPFAPRSQQTFLYTLVSAMLAAPCEMELHVEISGVSLNSHAQQTLSEAADRLCSVDLGRIGVRGGADRLIKPLADDLLAIQSMLKSWSTNPFGVSLKVSVHSDERVPVSLLNLLGAETFQDRPFSVKPAQSRPIKGGELDFSSFLPANAAVPAFFPSPSSLDKLGWPRHYSDVRFRTLAEGVVLGDIPTPFADEVVRLGGADRSQHCYMIGSTGTGKSTLLLSLIGQDIEAGRGVALLDPHGDLFSQVLERIPVERAEDVVLIDFTDFDHVPGLNLLETRSDHHKLERSFIVQELTSIFKRLYGNVPESMGPMFFLYMRNAVALAMESPGQAATLLDVPRVFDDPTYRAYLLRNCRDKAVSDFWRGIAGPATGETSLSSIAPYITCKFTEFTQNELVRRVVGQPRTSVDFRKIMDQKKILLIKLSKGLLSEIDTRFLGTLLTGRIFAAAATRASLPTHERVPFHVYIDEFQNFTSDSLSSILSESRKFGLAMTLAHQDLGQMPTELRASLMANTGSKIVFRVGAQDAEVLAQYMNPHHTRQDLMTLPDHHALTRIKVANVPSPPFLLRTRAMSEEMESAERSQRISLIVECSRLRYCMPASVAGVLTDAIRDAHIPNLQIDDIALDSASRVVLSEAGIHAMQDFRELSENSRLVLLGALKSAVDRMRLKTLFARMKFEPRRL